MQDVSFEEEYADHKYCIHCGHEVMVNQGKCIHCGKNPNPKDRPFLDYLESKIRDDIKGKITDSGYDIVKGYLVSHLYGFVTGVLIVTTAATYVATRSPVRKVMEEEQAVVAVKEAFELAQVVQEEIEVATMVVEAAEVPEEVVEEEEDQEEEGPSEEELQAQGRQKIIEYTNSMNTSSDLDLFYAPESVIGTGNFLIRDEFYILRNEFHDWATENYNDVLISEGYDDNYHVGIAYNLRAGQSEINNPGTNIGTELFNNGYNVMEVNVTAVKSVEEYENGNITEYFYNENDREYKIVMVYLDDTWYIAGEIQM